MPSVSFVFNSILDIFYPRTCTICDQDLNHKENYYCLPCLHELPFLDRHPGALEQVQKIFWGRVDIERVYTLLNYQNKNNTQKILHEMKYRSKTKLTKHMGRLLAKSIPDNHEIDFMIPVPLHPKKERIRGYNQSLILAEGLREKTNIPILNNVIKRTASNRSQTQFSKYDRWQNVNTIFSPDRTDQIENKHILIVDDVLTTGATLEACATVLKNISQCKISITTLATRI